MATIYTSDSKELIKWARKAKEVLITMPGIGGGYVQVKKTDFIRVLKQCGYELEREYAFNQDRGIIYG